MRFSKLLCAGGAGAALLFASGAAAEWQVDLQSSCDGKEIGYAPCTQKPCNSGCEPENCELRSWGDWSSSDCTGLCERERAVLKPNNECGTPCHGAMIETKKCPTKCHMKPIDCQFGPWTKWDSCDGSSTQMCRSREIATEPELHGGTACTGKLQETKGAAQPDPTPCKLSGWSKWTACSVSCGDGQRTRSREILQEASHGGAVCNGKLSETEPCFETDKTCPTDVDCVWDEWTAWSGCTCSCAGGQKTRDRRIKISPKGAGMLCAANERTEISPCNTQPCEAKVCVDGKWAEWKDWGKCSAECGGGVQWRLREIVTEANDCGAPATGVDKEYRPCNTHSCAESVDCSFGSWTPWSDCSCTCDGVKRRARRIAVYGKGQGKWCDGHLKEVEPCNSQVCETHEDPVDCVLSEWTHLGPCSGSCGPGQHERSRSVVTEAKHGGKACTGALSEVLPCENEACPVEEGTPCVWGNWMEWGACDKCGGQRKRNRQILRMPENGGTPCQPGASEEAGPCPRHCHDSFYCEWGEWQSIAGAACSVSCGKGQISRVRYLKATKMSNAIGLSAYQDMQEHVADAEDRRLREVILSFACGGMISMVAFFTVLRTSRRSGARSGNFQSLGTESQATLE